MALNMVTIFPVLALTVVCTAEPGPQYYPLPFPGQQAQQAESRASTQHPQGSPQWSRAHHNFSGPGVNLDPVSYPAAEEIIRNDVPRQLYGPPPPSPGSPYNGGGPFNGGAPYTGGAPSAGGAAFNGGAPFAGGAPFNAGPSYSGASSFPSGSSYPQIYKLDNLIIIANPPQQQPCMPQRPPPDFPAVPDSGLEDRFGDKGEPSKCTWAIVACCSPGNNNVRYNCFELLGCPGFFFDNSPCDPKLVMDASQAALDYYSRSATNTSGPAVDTNRV